jgi:AcrR family transcriptional regulator
MGAFAKHGSMPLSLIDETRYPVFTTRAGEMVTNKGSKGASIAIEPQTGFKARYRTSQHTKLQKKQKLTSRQNLLEAARYLFTEISYAATTVDDIVGRAKISRATFYRHFDNKTAVAITLFDEVTVFINAAHEQFAERQVIGKAEIVTWLNQILDVLIAHRPIVQTMREVDVIEPQFDSVVDNSHDRLIMRLAKHIPAFARASPTVSGSSQARVRAHLLLLQFDQFCYAVAVRATLDRTLAVEVMSEQFCQFIDA